MLVFRGGAYATCMGTGGESAAWAAEQGMVGIEVEYGTRSTAEPYPANYSDAARAVRLVRDRALGWSIDPTRVGTMGFSAGGHLASLLSTQPALYRHLRTIWPSAFPPVPISWSSRIRSFSSSTDIRRAPF
jgi:acetyl esterase/lipase